MWHESVIKVTQNCMSLTCQLSLYKITIPGFGNYAAEARADWTVNAAGILTGFIAAAVQVRFMDTLLPFNRFLNVNDHDQSFFAWRIHVLSQKWPIPIALWVGCFFVVAGETAAMTHQPGTVMYLATLHIWIITVTQALLVLVDIINTVILCTYLRISKTGFSRCVL